MTEVRKLSTILFADITGYTALMQSDEPKAMQFLSTFKKELNKTVPSFGGQIVQYFGDACLLSFDSTSDSVQCAMKLQLAFQKENIPIRIGMHLGEVIFRENNAFGDGVNIASRIESMGVPGAILISKTVRDQIKNKSEFKIAPLGAFEFKNVEETIEVYAIANEGFVVPEANRSGGKLKKKRKLYPRYLIAGLVVLALLLAALIYNNIIAPGNANISLKNKSIAVLPFSNESANQENQYFCNGVMEGILDHLSKIPDLIVISRSSVEQFREDRPLVSEIGKKLNAAFIVEGSVQRVGDQAIIFAQLIHAKSDRHLWSKKYDRDLSDLFSIQAEITKSIADELQAVVAPELRERLDAIPTTDMLAYDYYLQGNEFHRLSHSIIQTNKEWSEMIEKSKLFYDLALQRDSSLAPAIVGLGLIEHHQSRDRDLQQEDYLEDVLLLANKAIAKDPDLTDAYLLRCRYYYGNNDLNKLEEDLDVILKLNPNNVEALNWKAFLLRYRDFDFVSSALLYKKLLFRVNEQDELDEIHHGLRNIFASTGDVESFLIVLELGRNIKNDSTYQLGNRAFFRIARGQNHDTINFINAYFPKNNEAKFNFLSNAYAHMGDFKTALTYYEKWDSLLNEEASNIWTGNHDYHRYGHALIKTGQRERGMRMLEQQKQVYLRNIELDRTGGQTRGSYYDLAGIYAFTGMKDSAYYWLDKLDEKNIWFRQGWLSTFIQNDYQFDNIRDDERFNELLDDVLERQRKVQEEVKKVIDIRQFKY